jgi:phosphoribosylformimino-5-aminoimidazole carboxamide ribotide isomerase
MITIPTISLRHGASVSLLAGNQGDDGLFVREPVGFARALAAAGFRRIQLIDIDGVVDRSTSLFAIENVIRDGAVGVQVVVDAQSNDVVDRLLDAGADSVVVRAAVVDDPAWIVSVAQTYPGSIVVATEVGDRRSVTRGWMRALPVDVFDLVDELAGMPLAGLLVSLPDTSGQATLADLSLLEDVAESSEFPVLTSTSVSSMNDLRALENRGVAAAVLGSVLYSGALDPRAVAQEFSG